jgi:hypothetical protein
MFRDYFRNEGTQLHLKLTVGEAGMAKWGCFEPAVVPDLEEIWWLPVVTTAKTRRLSFRIACPGQLAAQEKMGQSK